MLVIFEQLFSPPTQAQTTLLYDTNYTTLWDRTALYTTLQFASTLVLGCHRVHCVQATLKLGTMSPVLLLSPHVMVPILRAGVDRSWEDYSFVARRTCVGSLIQNSFRLPNHFC
jgi:hypothetical protein